MVGWMNGCLAATSFLAFLFDLGGWNLPSFQLMLAATQHQHQGHGFTVWAHEKTRL